MLKFYAVQVLCRSKFQTTWEPPAFWPFVAGFQADGNVERRPKGELWVMASQIPAKLSFGLFAILLETDFFCQENPVFHNWTLVYVPYCDGTSFSGDAVRSGVAESVKGCWRCFFFAVAVLAILIGVFVGAALPLVIWLRDTEGYQKCSLQLMCGRQTPFALGLPIVNACRLSQLSDKEVAPVIPVYRILCTAICAPCIGAIGLDSRSALHIAGKHSVSFSGGYEGDRLHFKGRKLLGSQVSHLPWLTRS